MPTSKFRWLANRFIARSAKTNSGGLRLVVDAEANGLLDTVTKAHCIVATDRDSDRVDEYGPEQIPAALEHLARADCLIGHNICGYDLPLLRRLHNWAPSSGCGVVDTLVASRLILPNLADLDDKAAGMGDPKLGKLRGSHSLEAWGVRLGMPKVGTDIEDWAEWTPEMQARCVGDVALTKALYHFLQPDGCSQQALELEHRALAVCERIASDGVPFDVEAAKRLCVQLKGQRADLGAQLREQLPELRNPNSRPQIGALLESRGWKPAKRTPKKGAPVIDEEVLTSLPAIYPEFAGLADYMLLQQRLGQLEHGEKALLRHIGSDGRIHGRLFHIGTPHSRASHSSPNLAAIPNPKKGARRAAEFRALFHHAGDWVFVACDQSNLQDRGFAHYLAEFDGGAYAQAFIAGVDQHWQGALALALTKETQRDKEDKVHTAVREGAKRFRYAFLFGAGATKLGAILSDTVRAVRNLDPGYTAPTAGGAARDRYIRATPGLAQLQDSLSERHRRNEWVLGLDGRKVPTGADYKSLNRIVTASEAVICKRWLIQVHDELCRRFRYGWDGDVVIVLWIHDELVCCCRPQVAEEVGEIMVRYAKEAGEHYGFKTPLDAEYKIGRSWAGELPDGVVAEPAKPNTEPRIELSTTPIAPDPDRDDDPGEIAEPDDPGAIADTEYAVDIIGSVFAQPPAAMLPPGEALGAAGEAADAVIRAAPIPAPALEPDTPEPLKGNGHAPWDGPTELPAPAVVEPVRAPMFDIGEKRVCLFHSDSTPSLHVYPDHVHCFSCGAHFDHAEYVMFIKKVDRPTAIQMLEANPPGRRAGAQLVDTENTETLAYAAQLFAEAKPIAGTLAAQYLAEVRGIDLTVLPDNVDAALRFHDNCPFGGGAYHPCLVALFRDVESDEPAGIHRIVLTPNVLAGKPVKDKRRTLGRWPQPRAVKLWPVTDQLFLAEGIETALAGAHFRHHGAPMQPAWAAGHSHNIERFPVLPGVKLTLLVDHDDNGAGERCAEACRQRYCEAGHDVGQLRTNKPHKDFNDLLIERRQRQ